MTVKDADHEALETVRRNLMALKSWDMLSMDERTFRTWCSQVALSSAPTRLADAPWARALIDEALAALNPDRNVVAFFDALDAAEDV